MLALAALRSPETYGAVSLNSLCKLQIQSKYACVVGTFCCFVSFQAKYRKIALYIRAQKRKEAAELFLARRNELDKNEVSQNA